MDDDGMTPGPCPRCDGTGTISIRWIQPAALARMLSMTPRRVRQLVAEGVIDPPVQGKGYSYEVVSQYLDWRFPRRHEHEMHELVTWRRADRDR